MEDRAARKHDNTEIDRRDCRFSPFPTVYCELRQLARAKMAGEPPGHTLDATALVHEAYLRIYAAESTEWSSPGHFYCAVAEAMRRILIERARRYGRLKHGSGLARVSVHDYDVRVAQKMTDLLDIDAALKRLEIADPKRAQVVKLRYYTGFSIRETADALGVSNSTVKRNWQLAKAYLLTQLQDTPGTRYDSK